MKIINKDFSGDVNSFQVNEEELGLINKYTRKPLEKDEVYAFNVILCDNEIDRDYERFDNDALINLSEMFLGVTGIFDHNPTAKNQSARIFKTEVEYPQGKTTSYGEQYAVLKAKAYMPLTEKNKDLITEIEAGIKKEVSVSCAVGGKICSVCANDLRSPECSHTKGNVYNSKVCCGILTNPSDAYEWSFVAVPAQPAAGVTKNYKITEEYISMNNCLKAFEKGEAVSLSEKQSKEIWEYIDSLKKLSDEGKEYRKSLIEATVKFAVLSVPDIKAESVIKMCSNVSISELISIKAAFEKKAAQIIPLHSQLLKNDSSKEKVNNNEYKF